MNIDEFEKQAEKLANVALEFPNLEVSWKKPFLRIYISKQIDWEVLICFSFSFNCPVLYFRSRTQYLTEEAVLENIHNYKSFISPAELPSTGEPFFMLHPCNTNTLTNSLTMSVWLSVSLKVFDTYLPLELYARLSN